MIAASMPVTGFPMDPVLPRRPGLLVIIDVSGFGLEPGVFNLLTNNLAPSVDHFRIERFANKGDMSQLGQIVAGEKCLMVSLMLASRKQNSGSMTVSIPLILQHILRSDQRSDVVLAPNL